QDHHVPLERLLQLYLNGAEVVNHPQQQPAARTDRLQHARIVRRAAVEAGQPMQRQSPKEKSVLAPVQPYTTFVPDDGWEMANALTLPGICVPSICVKVAPAFVAL